MDSPVLCAIVMLGLSGMAPRKKEDVNAEAREAAIRQLRKTRQVDNETQYKLALDDLKKAVYDLEGPDIKVFAGLVTTRDARIGD